MSSEIKTALLFFAMLALVVGGSFLYSRSMQKPGPGSAPAAQPPTPQAAAIAPEDQHPELRGAIESMQAGEYQAALERLERVPADDPSWPLALQNLGRCQWELGDLERARDAFAELAALDPESAEAHSLLSWAHYRVDNLAAAEYEALRTLEIAPSHLPARYNLGLYRVGQRQLPTAIDAYYRAMARDVENRYATRAFQDLYLLHEDRPDLAGVHYALALFANKLGRPAKEIEELEHYLAADPDGSAGEIARARLAEAGAL